MIVRNYDNEYLSCGVSRRTGHTAAPQRYRSDVKAANWAQINCRRVTAPLVTSTSLLIMN